MKLVNLETIFAAPTPVCVPEGDSCSEQIVYLGNRLGYSALYRQKRGEREAADALVKGGRSGRFELLHLYRSGIDASDLGLVVFSSKSNERDVLYFLGDFCRAGKEALEYRKRIRCKNVFFVEGNHDIGTRKIASEFRWWKQLAEVKVNGHVIVLCHYAMRLWHHSFRGSWQLYGHSHGRLPDDPAALSMDVGVDTHELRPWHLDEIAARMNHKAEALRNAARHEAINSIARAELEAGTYDKVVLPEGAEDA